MMKKFLYVGIFFGIFSTSAMAATGDLVSIIPGTNSTFPAPVEFNVCCDGLGDAAYCSQVSTQASQLDITSVIACPTAGIKLPQGYYSTNCAMKNDSCTFRLATHQPPVRLSIYQYVVVRMITPVLTQNLFYSTQNATGWPGRTPPSDWGFDGSGLVNFNILGNHIQAQGALPPQNNLLGCNSIAAHSLNGKIAVLRRGTCTFAIKVLNAQNAGAIGVVIANNVPGEPPVMGGGTPAAYAVTIPAAGVLQTDGEALISALTQEQNISLLLGNVGD